MNEEIAKTTIYKLSQQLKEASQKYYQSGNSSLEDAEYDALEKQLRELENQYPHLKLPSSPTQKISDGLGTNFQRIQHQSPMLSLKNLYTKEELEKWHQSIQKKTKEKQPRLFCDLKIDGMAISIFYHSGELQQAITRGDGVVGEDLTKNIRLIESIPKTVSYQKDFEIRGEIFFPKDAFKVFNQKRKKENKPTYKNPRNATVGTVRMKDENISDRGLQILIYDILQGAFSENHQENITELSKLGFLTNQDYCLTDSLQKIWEYHQKIFTKRDGFPFGIDGIVCRVNQISQREILGADAKQPRWAVALKFESEQAESKLLKIENSIGRTGIITPVAWVEPVELLGTQVQKASLHNYTQIQKLNICKGDILVLEKGGDIIPKVVRVSQPNKNKIAFIPPKDCPSCNSPLKKDDTKIDLFCINPNCAAIVLGKLEHFVSRKAMDIEFLGKSTLKRFYQKGWLKEVVDIYTLGEKKAELEKMEGFGEKSIQNLFTSIEQSKNKGLDKFIYALGIQHIGESYAKQLAQVSKTMNGFISLKKSNIEKLENFGEIVMDSVIQWLKENQVLLIKLQQIGLAQAEYQFVEKTLGTVVITGSLSLPRDEWKEKLENKGFKISSSVSTKTNILLVGNIQQEKNTSKFKKAKELGIEILDEANFQDKFF